MPEIHRQFPFVHASNATEPALAVEKAQAYLGENAVAFFMHSGYLDHETTEDVIDHLEFLLTQVGRPVHPLLGPSLTYGTVGAQNDVVTRVSDALYALDRLRRKEKASS